MSIAGANKETLRKMLLKCITDDSFKGCSTAVVETFYETVSNEPWESKSIIHFLEYARGITKDGDKAIEVFIKREKNEN